MTTKLQKLLAVYRELQGKELGKCEALDMKIIELQAKRQVLAAPFTRKMEKLGEVIQTEVLRLGESYVHPEYGRVGYRKGSVRITWSNGLDELQGSDVWDKIKKYRRETEIQPSAKIE